jgi:hypothetical protein
MELLFHPSPQSAEILHPFASNTYADGAIAASLEYCFQDRLQDILLVGFAAKVRNLSESAKGSHISRQRRWANINSDS